jgi:glycosyltransferase involved in cell wall biosynthesis
MAGRLLLVLPSIMKRSGADFEIDLDFSESLRLYMASFDSVTVACPVSAKGHDSSLRRCRRAKDLPWGERVRFLPLPSAYGLSRFLREVAAVRRLLRSEIEKASCLVFSPHTLVGDWATIAVYEAIKLKRTYVIEADVVYEKVAQVDWGRLPMWKRFMKKHLLVPLFQRFHRYCLENSGLALFQGQDVYDAYAGMCSNPHKVYHMPIDRGDYIEPLEVRKKIQELNEGKPLKLCYVGRAIDMKGPIDWLRAVHEINKDGVEMSAAWIGDGPSLAPMREMVKNLGLGERVRLLGYVSDRKEILRALREAHIFLFCHKTPESPRCLVEALASACPLIGYASAYPKELVARYGGGQFATLGDWRELADIVRDVDIDRSKLFALIRAAEVTGRLYERDATMQHRVDLINEYMNQTNIAQDSESDRLSLSPTSRA